MPPSLTVAQAIGQQFLLSFVGKQKPPEDVLDALRQQRVGGIVLFRHKNMGTLAELRGLTAALQAAAAQHHQPPLLIAADQEGGQLMAIGDGTPFPGNLALGATRSETLAYKVGRALGREVAAVGVNVNFAPVCDVNNNPDNPVVGTRSFGEEPRLVARLAAAMVRGLQAAGVAATAKHFPGHGDTASDSHHAAPVIPHGLGRLTRVELPPFKAAIAAGVRLVMTAHIVLPKLTQGLDVPATLSPAILKDLLRRKLRFKGLVVTDAMDMRAIDQDAGLFVDTLAAVSAGADLMIFNLDPARQVAAYTALVQAARRGLLPEKDMRETARRILALKKWLQGRRQPALSVVGCTEHRALARQVAEKSVTLVRDSARRLPVRLSSEDRIAVVVPRPEDLTPADTSSYLVPALAAAIGRHHPRVDEFFVSMNPTPSDVRALCNTLQAYDLVVVGTINATAHPAQAALVKAVMKLGTPAVVVALRMPYDLVAFPEVPTYACAYSILPPAMDAMAAALFGKIPFAGRLPVALPRHVTGR